jgi:hypothetical protein
MSFFATNICTQIYHNWQDYEQLGRAFCETLMDYYDDNPLKVNRLVKDIKKMRKEQRKARKALKAQRMAELLAEKERKHQLKLQKYTEYSQEYFDEQERLKKVTRRFSIEDSFNWDELEEELRKENNESGDDASDDENYPDEE